MSKIQELYKEIIELEKMMEKTNDANELKLYDAYYTFLEFETQKLLEMKEDIAYHKFWMRPKCECPYLDNNDRYPSGIYIKNNNCPLHGE